MTVPEIFLAVWILFAIAYLGESIWKLWRRSTRYSFLIYEIITPLIPLLAIVNPPSGSRPNVAKAVIVLCVATGIAARVIGRKRYARA